MSGILLFEVYISYNKQLFIILQYILIILRNPLRNF